MLCLGDVITLASKSSSAPPRSVQQQNYQTPASALYETAQETGASYGSAQQSTGHSGSGI